MDLCKTAVSVDNVSVVEMWLLKENRIAKATTPQGDQEIIKFCTKGDTVTETDVGILRYDVHIAIFTQDLAENSSLSNHLASRNQ